MTFIYFDAKHAVYVHDEIIRCSGGLLGILNLGLIESSLEHIQNDFYYPEMEHKLRHLFFLSIKIMLFKMAINALPLHYPPIF